MTLRRDDYERLPPPKQNKLFGAKYQFYHDLTGLWIGQGERRDTGNKCLVVQVESPSLDGRAVAMFEEAVTVDKLIAELIEVRNRLWPGK
jgi:hypothetical protein